MTDSLAVGGDLAYPEVHGHQCECDETEACRARQAFLARVLSQPQACAACDAPIHASVVEGLARLVQYPPYPDAPQFRCPACQPSASAQPPTAMADQE
jgi:hypothetical protein